MAYESYLAMSIQDKTGAYYYATQGADGWRVGTNTDIKYITLPDEWGNTKIVWERNLDLMGVFRSMSSDSNFKFYADARAIINHIRENEGRSGYGLITIYQHNANPAGFRYDKVYSSLLNFAAWHNDKLGKSVSIGFLDGQLYRDYQAYGGQAVNIPIFDNIGTSTSPVWITNATTVIHDGIKVLYQTIFESDATPENHLKYNASDPDMPRVISGYNRGQFGTGTHSGWHQCPSLHPLNITQNNGATTFIGNDILQPFLTTGNQTTPLSVEFSVGGTSCYVGDSIFWGADHARPYTSGENYSIHNYLNANGGSIKMTVAVDAVIEGNVYQYATDRARVAPYLGFVMWEIDANDKPPIISLGGGDSGMQFISIYKFPLNIGAGGTSAVDTPGASIYESIDVDIKYDRAYVFGLVYDDDISPRRGAYSAGGLVGGDAIGILEFSRLRFLMKSKSDGGASGAPMAAPYFPPSLFTGFRLHEILAKLVPYLASTRTDDYGFPIPVATPYTGVSNYLSNPAAPAIGDVVAYQILISSFYCLHSLSGRSKITMSLNDLFQFCRNVLGCGAAIELDADQNPTIFRVEPLSYFFDASTMILDLGYTVTYFEIEEIDLKQGANLINGYEKADTNSDFGVDVISTRAVYSTPLTSVPGTINMQTTGVLTEQTAIEKGRAQRVTQPVGTEIDPVTPSGDNTTIGVYIQPSPTQYLPAEGGNPTYPTLVLQDPDGSPISVEAYQLTMRDGTIYPGVACAQSTDPAAATAPYINGLHYPDRAINIELSPARNAFVRSSNYLHSILDKMDSKYLIFRNVYQMQYNNSTLGLSGMESNLKVGDSAGAANVITEHKDILIGNLAPQIFKPTKFKVYASGTPSMYAILASNPNGYVRFFWQKEDGFGYDEYKGFIMHVEQAVGTNAPTYFELWATPDYAG